MAGPLLYDRVRETSTTTGTGTLTLAGAVSGYRAFSTVGNTNSSYYCIAHQSADEWEVGIGTYTTSGTTLSRTTILASSNAGALVSFSSGTKDVFVVAPASIINASGATVPTSPMLGQFFLHTPTGRSVSLHWDGSEWHAHGSHDTMTLYVDGASGTDSIDKGYGTGANAYATIPYAFSQIPGSYSGSVSIAVAAGTYTAPIVVQGKMATGQFNISVTGVMSTSATLTNVTAVTAGSAGTQSTVTHANIVSGHANKMLRCTDGHASNIGVSRLIDSVSGTTATLVDNFPATIAVNDDFVVEDWATIIAPSSGSIALHVQEGQRAVYFNDIKFISAGVVSAVLITGASSANFARCWIVSNAYGALAVINFSSVEANTTYVSYTASGGNRVVYANDNSKISLTSSKIDTVAESAYGLFIETNSYGVIGTGTVISGTDTVAGVYINIASVFTAYTGAAHNVIRDFDIGIRAEVGSVAQYTATGTYIEYVSIPTADTSADANGSYIL